MRDTEAGRSVIEVAERYERRLPPAVVASVRQDCLQGEVGLAAEALEAWFYNLEIQPALDCVFVLLEAFHDYGLTRRPPLFWPEPPSAHPHRPGRFSMENVMPWRPRVRGWMRLARDFTSPRTQMTRIVRWYAQALEPDTVMLEAGCRNNHESRVLTHLAEELYQARLIPPIAGMAELRALGVRMHLAERDWDIWASRTDFGQADGEPLPYDPRSEMRVRDALWIIEESFTHGIEIAYLDDALTAEADLNRLSHLLASRLEHMRAEERQADDVR